MSKNPNRSDRPASEARSVGVEFSPESVVTLRQLQSLLSVVNVFRPYVIDGADESWRSEPVKNPSLDGGCAAAAQLTFINACARIDALLGDPERWDLREALNAATLRQSFAKQHEAFERSMTARSQREDSIVAITERLRALREKDDEPPDSPKLPKPNDPSQLY